MPTRIVVTRSPSSLVEKVKEVQDANRKSQLEKEADAELLEEARDASEAASLEPPQGGQPDTSVNRRPSAQRFSGGIFAAEVEAGIANPDGPFTVRVSVPGTGYSLEVEAQSTGKGSIAIPPTVIDNSLFTIYGTVYRYESDGSWATYRNGSFGSATNYSDPFAEPPRSSTQTDYIYTVSNRAGDQSTSMLLPLTGKDGVLIYVQNSIDIYNLYERVDTRIYESVNERNIGVNLITGEQNVWGDLGYSADWDASGHTNNTYTMIDQAVFAAYEIFAFYVSEDGVKQLDVPEALDTHIRAICPPVSVNGTASYFSTIDYDLYYEHDRNAYVDVIQTNRVVTYQSEPAFDLNTWRSSSRYGTDNSTNIALAQHFGLGYLSTTNHSGPFFTPAVYTYLNGPMNLNTDSAKNYEDMRSTYFSNAPFTFYAPCARTNACLDDTVTEFDVLRTQPTNVTTAVAQSSFRRNPQTDVTIGDPSGEVLYAWNWGKPGECRQKLVDLGFALSDLVP